MNLQSTIQLLNFQTGALLELLSIADNQIFVFGCVITLGLGVIIAISSWPVMPGVMCPNCAKQGVETCVLPGKHCPRCAHPC